MANRRRTFQIAEQIQELIAWELQRVADPRFHLVTVTSVVIASDMKYAKVYWMVSGGKEKIEQAKEAFENAKGMFKHVLSKGLKVRFIPELKFHYDDTADVTDAVEELLQKARSKSAAN